MPRVFDHFDGGDDRHGAPSSDSKGRALLSYELRRRLPVVSFTAPLDLASAEVVLCLWLGQLLDAHAAADERWEAPSTEWTLVAADFPSSAGPGGFGQTFSLQGGNTPGGSFGAGGF